MLREAATLARQDLAGLRPEERVELLDRQLTGAPAPRASACSTHLIAMSAVERFLPHSS